MIKRRLGSVRYLSYPTLGIIGRVTKKKKKERETKVKSFRYWTRWSNNSRWVKISFDKYRKYISNICQGKRNKYPEIVKLVVNEAIHILEILDKCSTGNTSIGRAWWRGQSSGYHEVRVVSRNDEAGNASVVQTTKCVVPVLCVPTCCVNFDERWAEGGREKRETWLGVGFRVQWPHESSSRQIPG